MSESFDQEKFTKFCGMLGSSFDPEVIAAARQAGAMLQAAGKTWADVRVSVRVTPAAATERRPGPPPGTAESKWRAFTDEEPELANWLESQRGSFPFAQSLYEAVGRWGHLTPNQAAAVERGIERERQRGGASRRRG